MSVEQAEQIRHKYSVKYWDWFGPLGSVGGDAIYWSLDPETRAEIDEAERVLSLVLAMPTVQAA